MFIAGKQGFKLNIDSTAKPLDLDLYEASGLVVIEDNETSSAVSAINYALTIDSDIQIIDPFSESEVKDIKLLIEDWQDGTKSSYSDLSVLLFDRIAHIDFPKYRFATFFTTGAPFSLILENQIPISHVHLNQYPNLFITDNIFIEKRALIGSSIVFSPLEFGKDEETEFVIKIFEDNNYFIKELVGEEASAHNMDIHVKEYPYDILHICSHGGEVKGYSVSKKFKDQNGNEHVIEYDDVISFYPEKGSGLVKVEHKYIWRNFNGYTWKSEEMKEQKYPRYVFSDMLKAIKESEGSKKKYTGVPKAVVPDSCAIKCSDFIYQAMFEMVAGFHTSPLIFNNTCWSWSGISDSFIFGGARGYIGTLWAINNNIAKSAAEVFYQNLFDDTILNSLHKANDETKGTKSQDIYIYWGLHFSTLKRVKSVAKSKLKIAEHLLQAHFRWRKNANSLPEGVAKKNSKRRASWSYMELGENFYLEAIEIWNRAYNV